MAFEIGVASLQYLYVVPGLEMPVVPGYKIPTACTSPGHGPDRWATFYGPLFKPVLAFCLWAAGYLLHLGFRVAS